MIQEAWHWSDRALSIFHFDKVSFEMNRVLLFGERIKRV